MAIGLALVSSVLWGTADFLGGLRARTVPLLVVLAVSQATGLILALAFVAATGNGAPSVGVVLAAGGCGLIGITALGAYYRALAVGPMSVVAPVGALGVIVPVGVGLAGGDQPGAIQIAGMAVAVAGVLLASREAEHAEHEGGPARLGFLLAGAAALGFGLFMTLIDGIADTDEAWAITGSRIGGTAAAGTALAVALLSARLRMPPARSLPGVASIGLLDIGANSLYVLATTRGLLSLVAVAASLYPAIAVLLATIVLGERLRGDQRAGVVAVLAGAAMIAAG